MLFCSHCHRVTWSDLFYPGVGCTSTVPLCRIQAGWNLLKIAPKKINEMNKENTNSWRKDALTECRYLIQKNQSIIIPGPDRPGFLPAHSISHWKRLSQVKHFWCSPSLPCLHPLSKQKWVKERAGSTRNAANTWLCVWAKTEGRWSLKFLGHLVWTRRREISTDRDLAWGQKLTKLGMKSRPRSLEAGVWS